jgi:hypothetical protein
MHVKALKTFMDNQRRVVRGDVVEITPLRAQQWERAGIAIPIELNGHKRNDRPAWFPDWRGQRACIVASGPSAAACDLEAARGKARVCAVNESWRLAPWADALYGADGAWWERNKGVPAFTGLKVTQDSNAAAKYPGLMRVKMSEVHRILVGEPGTIGYGGNSGFQALNLVVQWDATEIALVGFDMSVAKGVHWHGKHAAPANNPGPSNTAWWRQRLDDAAPGLAARGVRVVNCSPHSALTAYEKIPLGEWLAC